MRGGGTLPPTVNLLYPSTTPYMATISRPPTLRESLLLLANEQEEQETNIVNLYVQEIKTKLTGPLNAGNGKGLTFDHIRNRKAEIIMNPSTYGMWVINTHILDKLQQKLANEQHVKMDYTVKHDHRVFMQFSW